MATATSHLRAPSHGGHHQPSGFCSFSRQNQHAVPCFCGSDPTSWLHNLTEFFLYHHIAAEDRINMDGFYMEGPALTWFQWMKRNTQFHSWEAFIQQLHSRFSPATTGFQWIDHGPYFISESPWKALSRERPSLDANSFRRDLNFANVTDSFDITESAVTPSLAMAVGLTNLVKAAGDGHKRSDSSVAVVRRTDVSAELPSLSWVGNITKVGPQAIFVVGQEDDGDSIDGGSEVSADGANWETVDANEKGTLEVTEREADLQSPTSDAVESGRHSAIPLEDNNVATSGPLSMPFAALGFVARLDTGLFSQCRKQSDRNIDDLVPIEVEYTENGDVLNGLDDNGHIKEEIDALNEMSVPSAPEVADNPINVAQKGDDELLCADNLDITMSLKTNANIKEANSNGDPCSFKHFDIAAKPLDHFYLNGWQNYVEGKWVTKVQQEWSILEKILPDDIYARVFEDWMDFFRAEIMRSNQIQLLHMCPLGLQLLESEMDSSVYANGQFRVFDRGRFQHLEDKVLQLGKVLLRIPLGDSQGKPLGFGCNWIFRWDTDRMLLRIDTPARRNLNSVTKPTNGERSRAGTKTGEDEQ